MLWHSTPLGGWMTSPGWGLWLPDAVDFGSCENRAGRGSLIMSHVIHCTGAASPGLSWSRTEDTVAFTEGLLLDSQSVWQAGLRGSERGQRLPTVVGRWASSPGQVHQAELQ